MRLYHLPKRKAWNAKALVEALQKRGLKAKLDGEHIEVTLPVVRIDIAKVFEVRPLGELRAEVIGENSATISYSPSALLKNIVLEYVQNYGDNCYTQTKDVTQAILECGYDSGSLRELANKYCNAKVEIHTVFARLDELQQEIDVAIAEHRFEDFLAIRNQQQVLRQQIEELLRDSFRED